MEIAVSLWEWVKDVAFSVPHGVGVVFSTLLWAGKLLALYTLGWFLLGAIVAIIKQAEGITITQAFLLGVFTMLFHILFCAVRTGVCG